MTKDDLVQITFFFQIYHYAKFLSTAYKISHYFTFDLDYQYICHIKRLCLRAEILDVDFRFDNHTTFTQFST